MVEDTENIDDDRDFSLVPLDLEAAELQRHSVTIAGHRTSISIERGFWRELQQIARAKNMPLAQIIRFLDEERSGSLSGAIRSYVLQVRLKRSDTP